MNSDPGRRLEHLFRLIIAKRWWVVLFYALLVPPCVYWAVRVEQDNSLSRLIVQSDPEAVTAREFERVFGSGEFALLLAEADDPFAPDVLRVVDGLERALGQVPGVEATSALTVFRRSRGSFEATPEQARAFRRFVEGTDILRRQGLVGGDFLAVALVLDDESSRHRRETLARIDDTIQRVVPTPSPLRALRKVGEPYVNAYLDRSTDSASTRYFPLFGLFVVVLNLALYRSFRALAAFLVTLGVSMALAVGYVGMTGGVITLVSPLVPMVVLITTTATLVYIHSRYVEHPEGSTVEDHQVFALVNKFVACTASIFATAVGFAALVVSKIQPIRDMGIWVAVGLLFTWLVVFTLFPALQRIFNTPTQQERRIAGRRFLRLSQALPHFSYKYRWPLIFVFVLLSAAGAVALFGFPGVLKPMPFETDSLTYIDPRSQIYKDTRRLETIVKGLTLSEVWIKGEVGSLTEPDVLSGLNAFQEALERDRRVGSVIGATTILRLRRYLSGHGDAFPGNPEEVAGLGADLEQLLPDEPMLGRFVDPALSQTHVAVLSESLDFDGIQALKAMIEQRWRETARAHRALAPLHLAITGVAPLQAKIGHHLVPTLVESFIITVVIIFGAFLLVFRNGPARLMAMIPSVFAILVMFAVMRISGMALNVATILIASTVLGTSENDQIHFFYHFLEKRQNGSVTESLRHTLLIAGRAILFATLINAGGFLAFSLADLPPMREFGILTALAFGLSMLADFTALPAALWIVFRERPD